MCGHDESSLDKPVVAFFRALEIEYRAAADVYITYFVYLLLKNATR